MKPTRTATAAILATGALLLATAPAAAAAQPSKPRIARHKLVPCPHKPGTHQTPPMACLKLTGPRPVPFTR